MRVLADVMAVSAAYFITSIIRFEILDTSPAQTVDYTLITLIATPANILLFWLYGLYEPRQVLSPINEFKQVFHGVFASTALLFVADSILNLRLSRSWVLLSLACGLVVVGGERLAIRKMLHFLRRRGVDATQTIVLGTNTEARAVARTLEREGWLGYSIVLFVDDDAPVVLEITIDFKCIWHTY